jgi:hypothetical protein
VNNDTQYQRDKTVILFNSFTGNFDYAIQFNENRIVTHAYNAAGHPLMLLDQVSNQETPIDDLVVTDNAGNVVVV